MIKAEAMLFGGLVGAMIYGFSLINQNLAVMIAGGMFVGLIIKISNQ